MSCGINCRAIPDGRDGLKEPEGSGMAKPYRNRKLEEYPGLYAISGYWPADTPILPITPTPNFFLRSCNDLTEEGQSLWAQTGNPNKIVFRYFIHVNDVYPYRGKPLGAIAVFEIWSLNYDLPLAQVIGNHWQHATVMYGIFQVQYFEGNSLPIHVVVYRAVDLKKIVEKAYPLLAKPTP